MSLELLGHGLGSVRAWEAYQEAKRRFPRAKGFEISYRGRRPKITPVYTRSSGTARSEHEALERRLQEIKATLWK